MHDLHVHTRMYILSDTPLEVVYWLVTGRDTPPFTALAIQGNGIVSMAPNHGCEGERSIMQYESKTFYLQQNIIINIWNLRNETLTHAIVYGLMANHN